jgi:predicted DNA-binding transcriptional regulator YafY
LLTLVVSDPALPSSVRADRLLALLLLLQARGRTTAAALAEELEVSVRTIYRDMEALGTAGVPVFAESGPGGGCELLAGYRSPLDGLSAEEANALLILGVPAPLRELGLESTLVAAQARVKSATARRRLAPDSLVHLDMPRWFHRGDDVPWLATLARAVEASQRVKVSYRADERTPTSRRTLEPLGLVNKAGVWYVVAVTNKGTSVFRVSRIHGVDTTSDTFTRPKGFDLVTFWDSWSADFVASRPRIDVTVRASPRAVAMLPEILGDAVRPSIDAAGPTDAEGWRHVVLTFEHVGAAAYRLSGFGDLVEVVAPRDVREDVIANARRTLVRYGVGVQAATINRTGRRRSR